MKALQHLRIKYRWEEIEKETKHKKSKKNKLKTHSIYFENDDNLQTITTEATTLLLKKTK
jgi:hypothetical protein